MLVYLRLVTTIIRVAYSLRNKVLNDLKTISSSDSIKPVINNALQTQPIDQVYKGNQSRESGGGQGQQADLFTNIENNLNVHKRNTVLVFTQ